MQQVDIKKIDMQQSIPSSLLRYSHLDWAIIAFDKGLRILSGGTLEHPRSNPAKDLSEPQLTEADKSLSGALMRINHTGEVCAQALYQGQALTSGNSALKATLRQAQNEEVDHLAWCADRLKQLDNRPSWLNPVWYLGSLTMGAVAGGMGDEWNLGFLAETERQVEAHLSDHLQRLPVADHSSAAILKQMQTDEAEHADMAEHHGARALPYSIKRGMYWTAKLMKGIAYYL